MLKDILGQAWEAMVYNRRRTAITMIGMAWGIATVVLLLAYGAGFNRAIENIFAQWGTNLIGVFPGRTSQQAGRRQGGSESSLHHGRRGPCLQFGVPGVFPYFAGHGVATRPCRTICTPTRGKWTASGLFSRTSGSWIRMLGASLTGPRTSSEQHVCVIGSEAKTKLVFRRMGDRRDHPAERRNFTVVGRATAPRCRRATTTTAIAPSMCRSTP
jgi:putative ABC transport system permease protein